MRRIAIALAAAVIGAGAFDAVADARPSRDEQQRSADTRVVKREKSRRQRARNRSNESNDRREGGSWGRRSRDRDWDGRSDNHRDDGRWDNHRDDGRWDNHRDDGRWDDHRDEGRSDYRSYRYRDDRYSYGHSRPHWHSYPLYRAFEHSSRLLLRSHYHSGYGYRPINTWYGPTVLQFINVYDDGSCDVIFNGARYHGYSRYLDGHQVLYLGTAPTGLGFALELVLY